MAINKKGNFMVFVILIFLPAIVLIFLIISKINLCEKLISEFNLNKKAIDDLERSSDFELGSSHLYK